MQKTELKQLILSFWVFLAAGIFALCGCADNHGPDVSGPGDNDPTREESIPDGATKMTPETDHWPPVLHSPEWGQPVPMEGQVNTAGVEDAPVITPDGNTFIFFFTPDGNAPAQEQLVDGVSGVWWCTWGGSEWTEPERAHLAGEDEVHLDGPFAIQGNILWFGSARVGNYNDLDIYTAVLSGGEWINWQNAGVQINQTFDAGELYLTADGQTLYFGAQHTGTGVDLWRVTRNGQEWSIPVNLGAPVNSSLDEGQPFVSSDGSELWFARLSGMGYQGPAIFRSTKTGDTWSEPTEIVSNFVGDPGLDSAGNLYFTHLFYDNEGNKIEADIYVASRH